MFYSNMFRPIGHRQVDVHIHYVSRVTVELNAP
jgi:hypothetical protein